jgi:hypothetical protein
MSNKYRPHIWVLPEDDRNRQIANGFLQDPKLNHGNIKVMPVAGGWRKVLARFEENQVRDMKRYSNRHLVLLIDFDGQEDRLDEARKSIPADLADRVFILGAWTEPERLTPSLGNYESIGRALARDCRDGRDDTWGHELLRHNLTEVTRFRRVAQPILFEQT